MSKTIHVALSPYAGPEFPEADRYPEWVAGKLAETFPGFVITTEVSERTTVRIEGLTDEAAAEAMKHEVLGFVQADLWNEFCDTGFTEGA